MRKYKVSFELTEEELLELKTYVTIMCKAGIPPDSTKWPAAGLLALSIALDNTLELSIEENNFWRWP